MHPLPFHVEGYLHPLHQDRLACEMATSFMCWAEYCYYWVYHPFMKLLDGARLGQVAAC